jgi:ketosteroid isomerase-like protein
MSNVRYPVFALLVGFSFGCAPAPPAIDLDSERKKLEEAVDAYNTAAGAKDVEKIVSLYTSDASILPPDAPEAKGTDGVRSFASSLVALSGFSVEFGKPSVHISPSGDMGYSLTDARLSFHDPAGTPVVQEARDLHIWQKDADGAWRVAMDMWNSGQPAPLPPSTPSP